MTFHFALYLLHVFHLFYLKLIIFSILICTVKQNPMPYNAFLAYCYSILSHVLVFMFILLSCTDFGACHFLVLKQFELSFLYKKGYTNKAYYY